MNYLCIDEGKQGMRNVQKSTGFTLEPGKGKSGSPEWLHCLREPEFKNHVFSPGEWGVFSGFPLLPIFCRLSSQLGTVICSKCLNNVDWGRIRGCVCLQDVKLCFNGGFCVGS